MSAKDGAGESSTPFSGRTAGGWRADRTFEITFLQPGAEAYVFTFG